jgi:hypothetical protein
MLAREKAAMDTLFADQGANSRFMKAQQVITDFEVIRRELPFQEERPLFDQGGIELERSLFALAKCDYRNAFAALRLFFELSIAGILFSTRFTSMRLWLRGEYDIRWAELVEDSDGIFSKSFARVCNEDLGDLSSQYREMGRAVYRECSEYVHANVSTLDIAQTLMLFRADIDEAWHDKLVTIRSIVIFCLLMRYGRDVVKAGKVSSRLEAIFIQDFGHVPSVRSMLS